MEKRSAHYQLQEIQEIVFRDGRRSFTSTAIFNSLAMGLTWEMVVKTILSMTPGMFYKSMTTKADHTSPFPHHITEHAQIYFNRNLAAKSAR